MCVLRYFAIFISLAAASMNVASARERSDLWHVVHDLCEPLYTLTGVSLPCLKVDRSAGYAVVRDPGDKSQILIVPLTRIDGTESPALLRGNPPNYWQYAWSERSYVIAAASRPLGWDDIGMAVNSSATRAQDQLHIHVDCVDSRLKARLAAHPIAASHWTPLSLSPISGFYFARRFSAPDIDRNFFMTIADQFPAARIDLSDFSIGVIGVRDPSGNDGFVVFAGTDGSGAEELLDHHCRGGVENR